jgi:hypothetical protein
MRAVRQNAQSGRHAYVHPLPAASMLAFQGLAGKISREERVRWRRWMAEHSGHVTDPSSAPGDGLPRLVDFAFHAMNFLRHPRSFIRDFWRENATASTSSSPKR